MTIFRRGQVYSHPVRHLSTRCCHHAAHFLRRGVKCSTAHRHAPYHPSATPRISSVSHSILTQPIQPYLACKLPLIPSRNIPPPYVSIYLVASHWSTSSQLDQLRCELQEKEEMFSAENDRLRLERNDIKDRAKSLWVDIENLRREM